MGKKVGGDCSGKKKRKLSGRRSGSVERFSLGVRNPTFFYFFCWGHWLLNMSLWWLDYTSNSDALLNNHRMSVFGQQCDIQGFENIGCWAAELIHKEGEKVVAVSNMTEAIRDKNGIEIPCLMTHVKEQKGVKGFVGANAYQLKVVHSIVDLLYNFLILHIRFSNHLVISNSIPPSNPRNAGSLP